VSENSSPILIVIAGSNGAGKSTFTASLGDAAGVPVLDPDAVARRLQPLAPERAAVRAGREILQQQDAFLTQRLSFAVETTLAGTGALHLMDAARSRGYVVHLVYIGLENVQTALDRIVERHAQGGHSVPAHDVGRRYGRSMRNLHAAVTRADHVLLFDNSSARSMRLVLSVDDGRATIYADVLPVWVSTYLSTVVNDDDR